MVGFWVVSYWFVHSFLFTFWNWIHDLTSAFPKMLYLEWMPSLLWKKIYSSPIPLQASAEKPFLWWTSRSSQFNTESLSPGRLCAVSGLICQKFRNSHISKLLHATLFGGSCGLSLQWILFWVCSRFWGRYWRFQPWNSTSGSFSSWTNLLFSTIIMLEVSGINRTSCSLLCWAGHQGLLFPQRRMGKVWNVALQIWLFFLKSEEPNSSAGRSSGLSAASSVSAEFFSLRGELQTNFESKTSVVRSQTEAQAFYTTVFCHTEAAAGCDQEWWDPNPL